MAIGVNLPAVRDYSSFQPFRDVFRVNRGWLKADFGTLWTPAELQSNPQGYPTVIPADPERVQTLILRELNGRYPGGLYDATWDGDGTVEFGFDAQIEQTIPGGVRLRLTPSHDGVIVTIRATNSEDPIRNIQIVPTGSDPRQTWNPTFRTLAQPFRACLRFMDWGDTNDSEVVEWVDRVQPDWYTQAEEHRGAAVEHMVDLCNDLQADMWVCIPHQASDDYVRELARLILARSDPRLSCRFEYTNEGWNGQFSQHAWLQAAGEGLDPDPFRRSLLYYSRRAVECFDLVREIWTGANQARAIRVLGTQIANPWVTEQIVDFVTNGQPASAQADECAGGHYFGNEFGELPQAETTRTWTPDQLFAAIETSIDADAAMVTAQNMTITSRGLRFVGYEGNQHLAGVGAARWYADLNTLFDAVNRDARMGQMVDRHLTQWNTLTNNALRCEFHLGGIYSDAGRWGLLEYPDEPLSSPAAAKYVAAAAHARGVNGVYTWAEVLYTFDRPRGLPGPVAGTLTPAEVAYGAPTIQGTPRDVQGTLQPAELGFGVGIVIGPAQILNDYGPSDGNFDPVDVAFGASRPQGEASDQQGQLAAATYAVATDSPSGSYGPLSGVIDQPAIGRYAADLESGKISIPTGSLRGPAVRYIDPVDEASLHAKSFDVVIRSGAALGGIRGAVQPLQPTDKFQGFAADTSLLEEQHVRVFERGTATISIDGVSGDESVGATVYARTDDSFTLNPVGAVAIGRIVAHKVGRRARVYFEAEDWRL